MSDTDAKYFDLLTTGLGYINRVRAVRDLPINNLPKQ